MKKLKELTIAHLMKFDLTEEEYRRAIDDLCDLAYAKGQVDGIKGVNK